MSDVRRLAEVWPRLDTAGLALTAATGLITFQASMLLGGRPIPSITAAAVTAAALLPVFRCGSLPNTVFTTVWMVLAGLIGWLLGIRLESGPFGLVVIESWCSSYSGMGFGGAITKLRLFPIAHLAMTGGAMLGMAAAMRIHREGRILRCCVISLMVMPIAMIIADAGVLEATQYIPVRSSIQMIVAMTALMIPAGLLTRRLATHTAGGG